MKDYIFGVKIEEIRRQCAADTLRCDSNSPIQKFETLEPCIEGGRKILADPALKSFFRRIYTGRENDE